MLHVRRRHQLSPAVYRRGAISGIGHHAQDPHGAPPARAQSLDGLDLVAMHARTRSSGKELTRRIER
jgi:hypothetical protein